MELRRDMTDGNILQCVETMDKRQGRDKSGKFEPKGSSEPIGRSADKTANLVSPGTAIRHVCGHVGVKWL